VPYPAGHRSAVRKRIIDSARHLFNRNGFESVSLERIMAGVGLTHGGFYSYFKSKSDLYAEGLGCFSPTLSGRTAGRVFMLICLRLMSVRK
jgi:TetR/AcrR family transcriptional repressor of nem operon